MGKIIKWLMVIVFFVIGALLITVGAVGLAKDWADVPKWLKILEIVFGCCLLTSPYFLKK